MLEGLDHTVDYAELSAKVKEFSNVLRTMAYTLETQRARMSWNAMDEETRAMMIRAVRDGNTARVRHIINRHPHRPLGEMSLRELRDEAARLNVVNRSKLGRIELIRQVTYARELVEAMKI
jgi:hypothetical protein